MRFKRLMPFWILVLIIIVIAVICMPTAILGAETGDSVSSNEINKEDSLFCAEIYAKQHGVTVDEAFRRFRLQDVAGELSAELSSKEADTLAGIWIEHTPKFKVVVLFTRNAEEKIKPYRQKYVELANIVEVRKAVMSLVELQNVQDEVSSSAWNLGIPVGSEINVYENRVKVYVVNRVQFDSAVSEGRLALPGCVDVITVESLVYLEDEIFGGLSLSTCTSGFAVKNSSGTKGITTAAHCDNNQSYSGVSLPFQSENYGTYYDIQWHTSPGFTVTNKIKSSSSSTTSITATIPRVQQIIGSFVAKYGKSTGFTAGYVSSQTFKPGTQFQATFIRVNNTAGYYDLSSGGDSGCPWFVGNTAWGSHCGSPGDDPNDAYYMAINYISGIGVSVMLSSQ
jgi:hypothetical protein